MRSPTENRRDDNDEIEDVPRLLEVILTKSDNFHETLEGEDCNEDLVDDEENVLEFLGLFVVFDGHRHHVEKDHHHDEDVELLVGHQLEQQPLRYELETKQVMKSR